MPRKETRDVLPFCSLESTARLGVLPWAGLWGEECGSSAAGELFSEALCTQGLSFHVIDRLFKSILLKDEERKMIMKTDVVLPGYCKGGI